MSPDTGHKKRLGRYHVTEYIGSGPCGEIHEARLDGVGRTFALKRFHDSYVADALVASGVRAAAKQYLSLQHPRIARLHSFDTVDEHTLAAVELVDGISLDLLLDTAKLPIGAWAKLIVQLGRGIGYAHGRGLCHLGISPTNIICVASGSISITDFGFLAPGLAKVAELDLRERLGYLAPEQLEGKRSSPASDVYSIGTIAYHLMTGTMPYGELTGKALQEAMLTAPIPEPDLPKPFKKLVQRALARSPFERFSDAGAMADAMEAAMRSEPLPGSLSDIGKLVFEQLGVGADEGENIVKSFNDIPTVVPGQTSPLDVALGGVPIAEIEIPPTIPHVAEIPKEVQNEMPVSSGAPDVFLGPAGSGPTGSGQQFIGGLPVSVGDTPGLSAEFEDDFSETDIFKKREPQAPVVERLPLQRAPTTSEFETKEIPAITPTENGFADFPGIEDEFSGNSVVPDKEHTTDGEEQTDIEDALEDFSLPTKVYPDDIVIPGVVAPGVVAPGVV
ncbi:MAG: serine/threonine protein kinase, partial [Kofleriaceae bacterium]|nr:serine/threonine protein kinase [Kofleriaceae bacterium]